jgi:hypothetical protein
MLSGCNLLGAAGVAAYKISGPPKVPAKYTPQRTRMLVLVENYEHLSSANVQADLLARLLANEIQTHDVAPVVHPQELQALKDSKGEQYRGMSIASVGRALDATQVLYVQLQSNDVSPLNGGEGYTGSTTAVVKLVDVGTGNTLWPTDQSAGYAVAARTPIQSPRGARDVQELHRALYADLASQISRLFYAWQPEDMSPQNYEQ